MARGTRHLSGRALLVRDVVASVLLVVIFYLVPVEPDVELTERMVRAGLAGAATVLLVLVIGRLVGRMARDEPGVRPTTLLVALFGAVLLFALTDYLVAISAPGQFRDLETKTDALYFAVNTLATLGFGDVSASGQFARMLVTVQVLFNLVVIATAGSVLVNRITSTRRSAPGDGQEPK